MQASSCLRAALLSMAAVLGMATVGCSPESGSPEPGPRVVGVETSKLRPASDDCIQGLVGMNVCDDAYPWMEFACGVQACEEMGNDHETAVECGYAFMDMAHASCDAVRAEQTLRNNGVVPNP